MEIEVARAPCFALVAALELEASAAELELTLERERVGEGEGPGEEDGHGALARAMRLYGPLAPVGIVVLASAAARRRYGAGRARAVLASIVGLVVQAVAGAPLLR